MLIPNLLVQLYSTTPAKAADSSSSLSSLDSPYTWVFNAKERINPPLSSLKSMLSLQEAEASSSTSAQSTDNPQDRSWSWPARGVFDHLKNS
jgi:hypothetical protein